MTGTNLEQIVTLHSDRCSQICEAIKKANDHGAALNLEAVESPSRGIWIQRQYAPDTSDDTIGPGSLILKCSPLRIVLEPHLWETQCSQCGGKGQYPTTAPRTSVKRKRSNIQICDECHIIGTCATCNHQRDKRQNQSTRWHSIRECRTLKAFCAMWKGTKDEEPTLYLSDVTSHLLCLRLLCGIHDEVGDMTLQDKTILTKSPWHLFNELYMFPSLSEYDNHVATTIVKGLQEALPNLWKELTVHEYASILGRVLGCAHAITNVSLPLGSQTVGRAIFLEHSFYNHSCTPNAFLSCRMTMQKSASRPESNASAENEELQEQALEARVYTIRPVAPGDPITLSYIPLSGWSLRERQSHLREHYGFDCDCYTCQQEQNPEKATIPLPEKADVDSIREIQFQCNADLLQISEDIQKTPISINEDAGKKDAEEYDDQSTLSDELDRILSLIRMTQRGMDNQAIPHTHEVRLESHRLMAMALSLQGNYVSAIESHEAFLKFAPSLAGLLDPVAWATQYLAFARDLYRAKKFKEAKKQWDESIHRLTIALGKDHLWLKSILNDPSFLEMTGKSEHVAKKQRLDP